MNGGRALFAILRADFLERTRRTGFLVTLCLVIYLGYAVNTGQILIKLGDYRGVYNSAWTGSLMALVITFFLGIAGFYLVKNTVERDEHTGVGQIIAAAPTTRAQYLLGKWLSNFAVLAALVLILALAAILMQVIHREDPQVQIWVLTAPFLFVALPMSALVAAFAVFFETVPWLKGGFGNLAYFGLFTALFTAGIFLTQAPWLDVTGVSLVSSSMKAAALAAFPDYGGSFVLAMVSDQALQTFVYPGIDWTPGLVLQRAAWLAVSAAVALAGALFFNRFDPSRRALPRRRQAAGQAQKNPGEENAPSSTAPQAAHLTPLENRGHAHSNLPRLAWLELLLLVKGWKWYAWAGMAVLWIGCAAAPDETMRKFWYMMAVLWPVLVWSKMGEREAHWQTGQLIYQAARPLGRLFAASWLAGAGVTAAASSGVLAGRLIAGEPLRLAPWLLSVLFIPTLALALGSWSRSSKLFEVVYPILWYLGPFNRENGLAVLDYLGIHTQAPVNVNPLPFLAFTALLALAALLGKRRQMNL